VSASTQKERTETRAGDRSNQNVPPLARKALVEALSGVRSSRKSVVFDAKRAASGAIRAWPGIHRGIVAAFSDEVLTKIFSA
jgi:hypothetical protein